MKYYFIIGIIIGGSLILYAIKSALKLKDKVKTRATVLGYHSSRERENNRVTRIEFSVEGIKRECDLNFYSIFWKKGKNITIYYNPNKYWEIECLEGFILVFIIGLLFLFVSIYCMLFVKL